MLNLEQIHGIEIPPLSILLSQCKLNSIFFFGNNPEKIDITSQMNKNKSIMLKKTSNLASSSLNSNVSANKSQDGKPKKAKGF